MKHIIAIVGMPGAGKSEASSFFKQKSIPVVRFGEITDEGLSLRGLPKTEANEKAFRENIREELGMAAYAIKAEAKIVATLESSDIVAIDGLRSYEEYEYLKDKFNNLQLLAIYASPQIRHERLNERKERSLTIGESNKRDVAEILNLHMGPPIALADHLIKNEATLEDLHNKLENYLKEVKKTSKF